MDNEYSKTLITNLVGNTLFKKGYLKKHNYTFNKDFIKEHTLYLTGKIESNMRLSLEIVGIILNQDEAGYASFREFMIDNLDFFDKLLEKSPKRLKGTKSEKIEIIDMLLEHANKNNVVEGLLIFFLHDKVKNLDAVTMLDINKGSITKERFESMVESYL